LATKKKPIKKTEPIENGEVDLLEDFNPDAEQGWVIEDDGEERVYWHVAEGSSIKGRIIGTDEWAPEDGEVRTFVKMHTTAPCLVVRAKQEEPEVAPPGTIVHVGVRHRLLPLYRSAVQSAVIYEAWIQAHKQVDIGNGQTVWNFKIARRATKQRRAIPAVVPEVEQPRDDTDLPF
jgi:hypothetical protein